MSLASNRSEAARASRSCSCGGTSVMASLSIGRCRRPSPASGGQRTQGGRRRGARLGVLCDSGDQRADPLLDAELLRVGHAASAAMDRVHLATHETALPHPPPRGVVRRRRGGGGGGGAVFFFWLKSCCAHARRWCIPEAPSPAS